MLTRCSNKFASVFCIALAISFLASNSLLAADSVVGEMLYNGIILPAEWPPKQPEPIGETQPVPYLTQHPKVLNVDVGRQLFIDDFLIETTTFKRSFHHAEFYTNNPVLHPDKPWEMTSTNPCAMVFSDGVWYDSQDRLFKMWYMGGYTKSTCFAVSTNGMDWVKPALDAHPGSNVILEEWRDSSTVWLDQFSQNPSERYKLFQMGKDWRMSLFDSADGIHWGKPLAVSNPTGDRSTVFYNPFRKVWVYSLRASAKIGRARRYLEAKDPVAGLNWKPEDPVWWTAADRLDLPREDLKTPCELYNLDATPYESIMLGLFTIWHGQPKDRPKPNEVCLGFSRDGFHWDRPDRRPFIPVSEKQGDWNWGNVQSAGGGCLVVARKLFFYVSGRKGVPGTTDSGECVTSLATLRRDGFASMDAEQPGTLTTRPLHFTGKFLFVNADTKGGEIRVEALDENNQPIAPFTKQNSVPLNADSTLSLMNWNGVSDISALTGKTIRFRFHLTKGSLYSFWVSPGPQGASHGYVAGGGPHFTGPTDTVGFVSYRK